MVSKKYEPLIFSLLMSLSMSVLMSGLITFVNLGLIDGFAFEWMKAFLESFIVAFPTTLILVPRVRKIVAFLVK